MGVQVWVALGLVGLAVLCPCPTGCADAAADTAAKTVVLTVEGMTCASCSVTIRTVLKKLPGVRGAAVSVKEKRAVVEYDPGQVTPTQMVEAVNKAGYRASVAVGS